MSYLKLILRQAQDDILTVTLSLSKCARKIEITYIKLILRQAQNDSELSH